MHNPKRWCAEKWDGVRHECPHFFRDFCTRGSSRISYPPWFILETLEKYMETWKLFHVLHIKIPCFHDFFRKTSKKSPDPQARPMVIFSGWPPERMLAAVRRAVEWLVFLLVCSMGITRDDKSGIPWVFRFSLTVSSSKDLWILDI